MSDAPRRGPPPVELTDDCAFCLLESGVVEIYDATFAPCRFGVPARTTCKLCGASHEGALSVEVTRDLLTVPANRCPACVELLTPEALDVRACGACGARATLRTTRAPTDLTQLEALHQALDRWAEEDGFATRDELMQSSLCVAGIDSLLACLREKRTIETVVDPFATMGRRTTGGGGADT
ncbi:MAG: hypothetical protein KC657_35235, partial [Myxococcales bacterium]|nr:hypothetical protein [Myxococcales bacterium]